MRTSPPVERSPGFTLIELMIVLALMGILSVLVISEMKGTYEGEVLRSTTRSLVAGLGLAYSQAVSLNQQHRLVLDEQENRYFIERLVRGEEGRGFLPIKGVTGAEGKLDERIEITVYEPALMEEDDAENLRAPSIDQRQSAAAGLRRHVAFFPDGRAQASEIRLRDRSGFGLALRVNPVTARVSVVGLEKEDGR